MAVESIRYTQAPLYNEKAHVISWAIADLLANIENQGLEHMDITQDMEEYMYTIDLYLEGSIDFEIALQKLQPMQAIENPREDSTINKVNSIIIAINSLRNTISHAMVFRWLAQSLKQSLWSFAIVIEKIA